MKSNDATSEQANTAAASRVSAPMRHFAVEALTLTAWTGSFLVFAPRAQHMHDDFGALLLAAGLSILVMSVVLVLASRAFEHKNPSWGQVRARYEQPYEWLAAIVGFMVFIAVVVLLGVLTTSPSDLVLVVGSIYAGSLVRSFILAAGRATQHR
jgi:hypothetical protein